MSQFTSTGDQVKIVRISDADKKKRLEALPSADTQRWVTRRKAMVVEAVRDHVISMEDVCTRYQISEEEFKSWDHLIKTHGVSALRATRLQEYRGKQSAQQHNAPSAE